ncbi:hypothetical protein ABPG72_002685 [Tetrahymena utriculariae]
MEGLIHRFKTELLRKLDQRSSSKSGVEATLIKSFKFFDLQNNGLLSKNEFFRGLAKVGVVPEIDETDKLFGYFDQNKTGKIDYKEFTAFILQKPESAQSQQSNSQFGQDSQVDNISQQKNLFTFKTLTMKIYKVKNKNYFFIINRVSSKQNIGYTQSKLPRDDLQEQAKKSIQIKIKSFLFNIIIISCERFCEKVRQTLSLKGASGLLSFALMLKVLDNTGRKTININQLESALSDFKIQEDPAVVEKVFYYLDKHNYGSINYEDFLNKLKVPLNPFRKSLITQAYTFLDRSNFGVINTAVVKSSYNPSNHPDAINGFRGEEDIKLEFRSSFESYLDLRVLHFQKYFIQYQLKNIIQDIHDDKMTFEDFVDYYTFLNHLWENDEQFKSYITSIWKPDLNKNNKGNKYSQNNFTPDRNQFSPPIKNTIMGNDDLNQKANQVSQFDQQDRRVKQGNFEDDRYSQQSQQQINNARPFGQQSQVSRQSQVLGKNQYGSVANNLRQVEFDRQSQQSQQRQRQQFGPGSQQVDQDTQSICSQATSTRFMQENNVSQRQIELILIRIKNRLASKGPRGFLTLERQLKTTDVDNDGRLSLAEFKKSISNFKIEVTETEITIIFNLFDPQQTGQISLFDFLNALKGQMNQFRFNLVNEVFNKIDQYGENVVTFADIQKEFYPRAHPDVKTAKRHEEDIAQELFSTLELHNKLYSDVPSNEISREQFIDYYNNMSASIQDDQLFESILVNTYRLSQQNSLINKYAGQRNAFDPEKKGFLQDHHRFIVNGGTVSSNAPFGTSQEPTHYSTQLRPYTSNSQVGSMRGSPVKQPNLYPPRLPQTQQQPQQQPQKNPLNDFRSKLAQRGVRGFIKLYQKFRNVMRDNQSVISYQSFVQALNELRLQIENPQDIFNQFERQGSLDLEDLFKALKGKIAEHRQQLIVHSFTGMDRTRCGEVPLELIKQTYDSRGHPNVKLGKTSDEEALQDFIDSFELHMQTFNPNNLNQGIVHFNEFFEFYHITSQCVEDDQYFEIMMRNCWHLNTY